MVKKNIPTVKSGGIYRDKQLQHDFIKCPRCREETSVGGIVESMQILTYPINLYCMRCGEHYQIIEG